MHWQPFDASRGVLLCASHTCLRALDMEARAGPRRCRSAHLPPEGALPERADAAWHVRHERLADLFCGGRCHGAYRLLRDPTLTLSLTPSLTLTLTLTLTRLMRDPATVRRELRKLHIKQAGSLHCQLCGVDLLAL